MLYFRAPVRKLLDESKKEPEEKKKTDLMEIAIAMEKAKELPDKNLINSAGVAIYKMMKSDSGTN